MRPRRRSYFVFLWFNEELLSGSQLKERKQFQREEERFNSKASTRLLPGTNPKKMMFLAVYTVLAIFGTSKCVFNKLFLSFQIDFEIRNVQAESEIYRSLRGLAILIVVTLR